MNNLGDEFLKILNKPDPAHGLLLNGIMSAVSWVKKLSSKDLSKIMLFLEGELSINGDAPIKEQIIKVLQLVGGSDCIKLLDKVICEGEAIHGKYLVSDARSAKDKASES